MESMETREYDIVIEGRTGIMWVVTKVDERGIEVIRRGEIGRVHAYLLHGEYQVTR
jgi:hypothetical protein